LVAMTLAGEAKLDGGGGIRATGRLLGVQLLLAKRLGEAATCWRM
jgi:hypothetical protein